MYELVYDLNQYKGHTDELASFVRIPGVPAPQPLECGENQFLVPVFAHVNVENESF
jgi:hypothetical protein